MLPLGTRWWRSSARLSMLIDWRAGPPPPPPLAPPATIAKPVVLAETGSIPASEEMSPMLLLGTKLASEPAEPRLSTLALATMSFRPSRLWDMLIGKSPLSIP
eukprot:SAG11_NODE_14399_length_613_cov_1.186770_1_plen_103_part_00